jgi:hypothetical protein
MAEVKDTYRTVTPDLVAPNADLELTFLKAAFDGTELGISYVGGGNSRFIVSGEALPKNSSSLPA